MLKAKVTLLTLIVNARQEVAATYMESNLNGLNFILSDKASTSDAALLTFGKSLQDQAIAFDSDPLFAFGKSITDSVVAQDSLARIVQYYRTFQDQVVTSDVAKFAMTKPFTDSGAASDNSTIQMTKVFTDTGIVSDASFQFAVGKTLTDTAYASETQTKGITKPLTDYAKALDFGSLRMTDYADFAYFAEDYVGTYSTF